GDERLDVPGPALVETVVKVGRAASRDETRPVLTGILVSASGDELRMAATDSYRLAVKDTRLESALASGFEANVPARALQELTRIVQGAGAVAPRHHREARAECDLRPRVAAEVAQGHGLHPHTLSLMGMIR
ncbi:MAG: hypothetical protein ACJ77L_14180, partial [Solirubrobacteraceae bacterium]